MVFKGYARPDGSVGVRNTVLVMSVADCSEPVARRIAEGIDGALPVTQYYGCIPGTMVANTLIGVGENPNVAAVLLVGMGCEGMPPAPLAEKIGQTGKPVEFLTVQEAGGTLKAVAKGKKIVQDMVSQVSRLERQEFDVGRLIVGVKCGGSDTTSGLAGNPAVGVFADLLVDAGGSVIMMEPIEAVGAEEPLAKRAISEEVRQKILKMIGNEEKRWSVPGAQMEFMCKGNVDGGLSTIEEKSLGAIHKSGSRPIRGVLQNTDRLLEKVPPGGGLYLQDGTHMEPHTMTFMAAAGAQIVVFVTGCGGAFGHAVSPLVKVTGNPETFQKMPDDIDLNAGTVMTGQESMESVGQRILDEVVAVASGKKTRGEELGYFNFNVYRRDPRLESLLGLTV